MNQFGHHIQSNAGLVGNSYQRRAKRKLSLEIGDPPLLARRGRMFMQRPP